MATVSGPVNLAYAIVALVVVVIVITTVAIPAISSAQEDIDSTSLNSTQIYSAVANDNVGTLNIVRSGTSITVGDYTTTLSSYALIALADEFYISYISGTGLVIKSATDSNVIGDNPTISGNTLTYSVSGVDKTQTFTGSLYYLAETGEYGVFDYSTAQAFVNSSSVLYAMVTDASIANADLSPASGAVSGALFKGKYNQMTATFILASVTGATITGATGTMTATDNGDLTYTPTGLNFVVQTDLGDYSGAAASGFTYLAPLKYTHTTTYDNNLITLLSVIPVLLILVPVMMAVTLLRGRS